jgi:hypothetical protein
MAGQWTQTLKKSEGVSSKTRPQSNRGDGVKTHLVTTLCQVLHVSHSQSVTSVTLKP